MISDEFVLSCVSSQLIRTRCYRCHCSNRRRHHASHRKDSHSCGPTNTHTHIKTLSDFKYVCFIKRANDVESY